MCCGTGLANCFQRETGCVSTCMISEMALTVNSLEGARRFEALLKGVATAAHDEPLLERPGWLVAPTLGAVVPGWLLAIPRQPFLSFRDWSTANGHCPQAILQDVRGHLGLAPEEVIWFEHGPVMSGTPIGCGLDHAHLHILVRPGFTFTAFITLARGLAHLRWQETSREQGYAQIRGNSSYLIAGCGDRVLIASNVECAGSQFFRRVVGALIGADSEWDYRRFPHTDNINRTIHTFRSLEKAVRHDK